MATEARFRPIQQVKVKEPRRTRKQQWVDHQLPTPPRSPTTSDPLESEPIMDDLWELWTGSGLIDLEQKFTIDSALTELGFMEEEEQRHSSCGGTYRRVSIGDIDEEGLFNHLSCDDSDLMTEGEDDELLKHLFQFASDDSPPPTNPPSPPTPGEMETDHLDISNSDSTFVINGLDIIKSEISSAASSIDGDSDDGSCPLDDAFSSDSGIDEEKNGMSPIYDEGLIGEDFINAQPDLFGDNPFESLLDPLSSLFEDEAVDDVELKHDCMWNGICCPSKTGKKNDILRSSFSPKIRKFDDFMKKKIKIEPQGIEINVKPEPIEELQPEDDAMCWSNDPYHMWAEETPPASQDPVIPSEVVEAAEELKGLDWADLIDDSKERYEYELELLRNATMNDHSYANIHHPDAKSHGRSEPPRKGIQGIVLREENGDDYSGGPRKTKILVPLKDLMDSLQHKTFLVAPLGPGKKVIRLTGTETVKGMLGVHHAAFNSSTFKSVSSYCVPQTSLFNRSANAASRNGTNSTFQSVMSSNSSLTSTHSRHKKSKANRSIIREGGTITFPNQVPSPSSPDSSLSSEGSPSSNLTASGRPKKTKTHNNMERMRRIDLRNSFDSLKKLVPPLAKSTKTSKVEILRRAEEYIRALKSLEKRLQREEATVRSRNEALKLKLLHSQQ